MASKIKADQFETLDGSGNITLNNSVTMASTKTLPAASLTGALPAISAAALTSIPAGNLTGTVADARISTLTASKLTGALPAISGANLTGVSAGKVLQVVSTTVTDTPSIVANQSWVDWSGLSVTITPSASSSKVLVTASVNVSNNADSAQRLVRGSTPICIGNQVGSNRNRSTTGGNIHRGDHEMVQYSVNFLDSPSTTSATTYKMQGTDNSGIAYYLNREHSDSDQVDDSIGASTITVMEIGA